jgi:hypothetical protein
VALYSAIWVLFVYRDDRFLDLREEILLRLPGGRT